MNQFSLLSFVVPYQVRHCVIPLVISAPLLMEAKRALRLIGPESPLEDLSRSMGGGGGPGGGGAGAPRLGAPPEAEATGPCETNKKKQLNFMF